MELSNNPRTPSILNDSYGFKWLKLILNDWNGFKRIQSRLEQFSHYPPRPSKECVNGMSFPVFDKEVKYFVQVAKHMREP